MQQVICAVIMAGIVCGCNNNSPVKQASTKQPRIAPGESKLIESKSDPQKVGSSGKKPAAMPRVGSSASSNEVVEPNENSKDSKTIEHEAESDTVDKTNVDAVPRLNPQDDAKAKSRPEETEFIEQ